MTQNQEKKKTWTNYAIFQTIVWLLVASLNSIDFDGRSMVIWLMAIALIFNGLGRGNQ